LGMRLVRGSRPRNGNYVPTIVVLFILIFSALWIYSNGPNSPQEIAEEKIFILKFSVTYENRGAHIWNLTTYDYTIGLFYNNSWQTVYLANHSFPIKSFMTDKDGNYVAVLDPQIYRILLNDSWSFEVEYRVAVKPRSIPDIDENLSLDLSDIPESIRTEFSEEGGPWQTDSPEIVDLARAIAGNETNVLAVVKSFIRWINSRIRYGTRDAPRYPNETLSEGVGDCDDQANLLITFLRIYGIPAYLQIGCIYLPTRETEERSWDGHLVMTYSRIGWHGWAMVYIPPWGWLPVDLTYAEGISTDPLNAIRKSAATLQYTVGYLRITESDYIASTARLRRSLDEHDFYIYEHDIMREESATAIIVKKMFLFKVSKDKPS